MEVEDWHGLRTTNLKSNSATSQDLQDLHKTKMTYSNETVIEKDHLTKTNTT